MKISDTKVGSFNTALIIETLTDNKNRSASTIGLCYKKMEEGCENGSTTVMFKNCGVIHIDKNEMSEEDAFNLAIEFGAKDCAKTNNYHEIITEKEDFYKVKTKFENKIENFTYSAIEWRALINLNLDNEQKKKMTEVLNELDELEDVQNIYTNVNLKFE